MAITNGVPYPNLKSAIMKFEYKDGSMKFASPVIVLNGEEW
jgi:hypothetical protein